jgi:hypothetical protein
MSISTTKAIQIAFLHATFRLVFEDAFFAESFEAVFQSEKVSSTEIDHVIEIMGNQAKGYEVRFDSLLILRSATRSAAAYCITRIFGDVICMHKTDSVCIVHAASVLLASEMVAFVGPSGSGKTTLALLFSQYGRFAGDEYAYLNICTGEFWHEEHPYQLKESNENLLSRIDPTMMLPVEGEPFGTAYYVSLATTNYQRCTPRHNEKLKYMVFPRFGEAYAETEISLLPVTEFPKALLQSCMSTYAPSLLFGHIVHAAAREKIHFFEVRFCDGADAAAKLFQYLCNEMR